MLILGVNKILNWVQITDGGRRYTCPIKDVDGELFFKFKNQLNRVLDYTSVHTTELISEGGKIISKRIDA